ncbi:hypothetical protein RHGRI_013789 [Rhododendron griersonianum]|nr:hypothetical protein RHGRI_013789 [Rhododendron griersonianum]
MHRENVRVLPTCRHIFYDDCIKTWLNSCTERVVCRHEYLGWEPEMLPPAIYKLIATSRATNEPSHSRAAHDSAR